MQKKRNFIFKSNFGNFHKFAFFWIFRRFTENGPSHIYERWKKKVEKQEMRLMNNQSKNISFELDACEIKSWSVAKALTTVFIISKNISYIFLRHSNPLWKTKWFLNESHRGQRDYCIHIYMILMQILEKANPT